MIPSIIIMLGCAATVAVQPSSQASSGPVTSDGIVAAIESDPDARDVIQLVLANVMAQRSHREFVLGSQISANWVPTLSRVEVVRLAATAVDRHLAACGRYLGGLRREPNGQRRRSR
jgi:hypothetical protein